MSKYTTQLRTICESICGLTEPEGYYDINQVIENSWDKIFDRFEIYDEAHRKELCIKIIKHYYMREIGFETPSLFKFYLNNTMNEIMPYYNELYKSISLDFNPLQNKNITRTLHNQSQGENGVKDKSTNKYLNTPQNGLSDIETGKYLTDARIISSDGSSTYSGSGDETETITGKDGDESYMKLIKEYRENIINVDLQIIEALQDCFMTIF